MINYVVYHPLNAICMSISEVKEYTLNAEKRTLAITGIDGSELFLDCVVSVCFSQSLFYVYYEKHNAFLAIDYDEDAEDLKEIFNGYF